MSGSSIIHEMHFQRGMQDVKQDLHKKISSYQSMLKKTYAVDPKGDPRGDPKGKKKITKSSRERDVAIHKTQSSLSNTNTTKTRRSGHEASETGCQPTRAKNILSSVASK